MIKSQHLFKCYCLNSDLGYGYDFIITNQNNNTIYDLKKITSNQTLKLYLAKGTYYVKINANYQYSAPSCYNIYTLKTKYYVRARAYYETPTGKRTYGKWSAIKSVKTK